MFSSTYVYIYNMWTYINSTWSYTLWTQMYWLYIVDDILHSQVHTRTFVIHGHTQNVQGHTHYVLQMHILCYGDGKVILLKYLYTYLHHIDTYIMHKLIHMNGYTWYGKWIYVRLYWEVTIFWQYITRKS